LGIKKKQTKISPQIKVAYISICDLQFNHDGKKNALQDGTKRNFATGKKATHSIWHSNWLQTHLNEQLR